MKLSVEGKFRLAVQSALLAGFALSGQAAMAQDTGGESSNSVELEKIEVTGSRLSRSDVEGALPVTVIDRAQIEATGLPSVADVIRTQSFNSFGSYREVSGDSFTGQAQASMRGLGAERTLILIDGRRVPPSPVAGAGGADLNTIPLAAVERIEILQDGASAIYGSDAIGGVINIILRKDINGVTLSAMGTSPSRDGGAEQSASLVGGISNDKTRIVYGISWTDRNHVALADRKYTSFNPGDGVNFSTVTGANVVGNTLYGYDSHLYYAAPSCDPSRVYTYDAIGSDNKVCIYPYANVAWDTMDLRNTSFFLNGDQKITDKLSAFFQTTYSRVETLGRFAAVPGGVPLGADVDTNPLGQDAYIFHRFEQLGPRNNYGTNSVFTMMAGLQGDLGPVSWDAGVRQSRYNFEEVGRNYALRNVALAYLENGKYNPFDPSANSQQTLNEMKVTINRSGEFIYQEAFANATFNTFALPAGMVKMAVGLELRDDRFEDLYDSQSEAGQVLGSAGNSAAGARNAKAGYVEALVPLLNTLEADIAFRYDDYSDFGDAVTGKGSLRWQPIQMLTLRGSYGTGFRAPTLSDLYGATAGTAPTVKDYTRCRAAGTPDSACNASQISSGFQASNANLDAEESDQYSLGFVLAPLKWLDFGVDYYNIKIDNGISTPTFQQLINYEANGLPLPDGAVIERGAGNDQNPVGRVTRILTLPSNVATIKTSGLDFKINGKYTWGDLRFYSNLNFSYVLKYVDSQNKPGQDQVGDPGIPEYRGTFTNTAKYDSFSLTWIINHIADTSAYTADPDPSDDSDKQQQYGHVASNTTHDFQLTWTSPINTEVGLGVRDAFNRGPSLNYQLGNPNYDSSLYNTLGRVPYLSIKQSF